MGRLAEVNRPCVLEVKTYDGNSTRTIQARVYNDAGTEETGSPFTPTHFARGNYKTLSWAPTVQGNYIVNYEIFVDSGCLTLDTNYVQFSEVIFIRSTIKALYDGVSSYLCDGNVTPPRPAYVANTSTTIQLDYSASIVTDFYKGGLIQLVMFPVTVAGQSRVITAYNGTTKVATVGTPWAVTPDNTSLFSIRPWDSLDKTGYSLTSAEHTAITGDVWNATRSSYQLAGSFGLSLQHIRDNMAQGGAAGSITLDAGASLVPDFYKGQLVLIYSGVGIGQSRVIIAYNGSTKVANMAVNWATPPDNTSKFIILQDRLPLLGSDGKVLVSADVHTSGETVANITSKTGYSLANGSILSATFATDAIDANAIAANSIDSSALATDAVTEITNAVAAALLVTPANKLTTDVSGFITLANGSLNAGKFALDAIDANALAASAVTEIAGGILLDNTKKIFTDASGNVRLAQAFPSNFSDLSIEVGTGKVSLTTAQHAAITADVWNVSRSSHQITGSFGLSNQITIDGTAVSSGTSTITLDSGASATANLYNGNLIYIYSGTGFGQTRIISGYTSGKVATVSQPWVTSLDGTSKYIVFPTRNVLLGSDGKVLVSDGAISNTTFATNAIDANAIAADAIGSSELATSAVDEIAAAILTTPANKLTTYSGGTVNVNDKTGFSLANGSILAATFATNAIDANAIATSAVTEIAGGILLDNTKKIYTDAFGNVSIAQVFPSNFPSMLINPSGQITVGTNADKTDYTLTSVEHTTIGADVWNAQRNTHQVTGSFGISNQVSRDAMAQIGSTSTTINLDASASASDSFYNNSIVFIMDGMGAGQSKLIKAYNGTSKVATVDSVWATTPDNTSKFTIIPFGSVAYQIFDKVIDVKTFAQVQEIMLAYASGKIIRTGNSYEYEKQDNVTPLFTLISNPGDRTRL